MTSELYIEYAGFWRRFAAFMIDQVILSVGAGVLIIGLGFVGLLVAVVGAVTYDILYHHRFGATLGQRFLGIRVVAISGRHPSLAQSCARLFAHTLSAFPFYYGFLRSIWHGRRQTWHDQLAGTYVIRTNSSGIEELSENESGWPLAHPFKSPRPALILCFVMGILIVAFLSQLWLKSSNAAKAAQGAIVADAVVQELAGAHPTVTFRYGNPLAVLTAISIGNIYFRAEGDSGTVYARAHVYSVSGNLGSWVDIDEGERGYNLSTSVGRRLCVLLARKGTSLLESGDSVSAYRLFRRAMTVNFDYTDAMRTRKYLKDDTAFANSKRNWSSNEIAAPHYYVTLEGNTSTDVDREASFSHLIRNRLVRGFCCQVLGEPSEALKDYDSLLISHPWLFPTYLDKCSSFLQMDQTDSAEYYLKRYMAVEPDSCSTEFRYAEHLQSRLATGASSNDRR